MKQYIHKFFAIVLLLAVVACSKKNVDPQLPSYLRVPANLTGYVGSGLVTINGDLTLRAEGPEMLDATTKTYSGVGGIINKGFTTQFTVGQPLPFKQNSTVPPQYQANGQLLLINAIEPGTYPMGYQSKPTPTGANADFILNLPGPQLYSARLGTLTITESTVLKTEGTTQLYRLQGTLQAALTGVGTGTSAAKDYAITGTFDLLLID